jgi:hypothetical protein
MHYGNPLQIRLLRSENPGTIRSRMETGPPFPNDQHNTPSAVMKFADRRTVYKRN